jgi:ribosome maturation factor RimP
MVRNITIVKKDLIAALEPAAAAHDMELVDIELLTISGQATVRVYLEPSDGSGSPSIDALAAANAWVDPLVEAIDPYPGAYALEVSSPGVDRNLRTLRHFERFVGETVRLRTEPINGRSNWTAVLAGVAGESVLITINNEMIEIALDKVRKANVQSRLFADRKVK